MYNRIVQVDASDRFRSLVDLLFRVDLISVFSSMMSPCTASMCRNPASADMTFAVEPGAVGKTIPKSQSV